MRREINVSIAGRSYTIAYGGYIKLQSFINLNHAESTSQHDSSSSDSIEERIVEQIGLLKPNNAPVSEEDVDQCIKLLVLNYGYRPTSAEPPLVNGSEESSSSPLSEREPETFKEQAEEERYYPSSKRETAPNNQTEETQNKQSPAEDSPSSDKARRIYRIEQGAIFGGVCSGLARYFNVNVMLFRLLFLSPFILRAVASVWWEISSIGWWLQSFGSTAIILYIVLWIITPRASLNRGQIKYGETFGATGESSAKSGRNKENVSSKNLANKSTNSGFATIVKIGVFVLVAMYLWGILFRITGGIHLYSFDFYSISDKFGIAIQHIANTFAWTPILIAGFFLLPFAIIFILILSAIFGSVKSSSGSMFFLGALWFITVFALLVIIITNLGNLKVLIT